MNRDSIRELTALNEMRSPHILQVDQHSTDLERDDQQLVYVQQPMMYSLDSVIHYYQKENKEIPEVMIKSIVFQVLLALNDVHAHGIAHTTLRPSCIYVMPQDSKRPGIITLGDFTCSRVLYSSNNRFIINHSNFYSAPEVLLGDTRYDTKIDIWSLGCIFLEMLTRHHPFYIDPSISADQRMKHQLTQITQFLGPMDRTKLAATHEYLHYGILAEIKPEGSSLGLYSVCNGNCLDLLSRMLLYNSDERISASEALRHPYFNEKPIPIINVGRQIPFENTLHTQNTPRTTWGNTWSKSTTTHSPSTGLNSTWGSNSSSNSSWSFGSRNVQVRDASEPTTAQQTPNHPNFRTNVQMPSPGTQSNLASQTVQVPKSTSTDVQSDTNLGIAPVVKSGSVPQIHETTTLDQLEKDATSLTKTLTIEIVTADELNGAYKGVCRDSTAEMNYLAKNTKPVVGRHYLVTKYMFSKPKLGSPSAIWIFDPTAMTEIDPQQSVKSAPEMVSESKPAQSESQSKPTPPIEKQTPQPVAPPTPKTFSFGVPPTKPKEADQPKPQTQEPPKPQTQELPKPQTQELPKLQTQEPPKPPANAFKCIDPKPVPAQFTAPPKTSEPSQAPTIQITQQAKPTQAPQIEHAPVVEQLPEDAKPAERVADDGGSEYEYEEEDELETPSPNVGHVASQEYEYEYEYEYEDEADAHQSPPQMQYANQQGIYFVPIICPMFVNPFYQPPGY